MVDGIKIYFAGLLISFLGSLPLGTLNITSMQIAVQENTRKALQFALGVAIVELLYVRVSLRGVDFLLANKNLFHILEWLTVLLFLALAVSSFITASKPAGNPRNILLNNSASRFWLGVGMSAINPVQIPFWFLWSGYLFSIHWLGSDGALFNTYTIGIGTGTISGLLLFIFGGKWLVNKLHTGHRTLNLIVGIVFLLSALIQLARIVKKPFEQRLKQNQGKSAGIKTVPPHSCSAYSAFRL